jgi:large subunit ribosomal protein L22
VEFTAKHRFARSTPRKARFVIDLVRSKPVGEALEVLSTVHRRPKVMIEKVIRSAMSNANAFVDRVRGNPEQYPDAKIDLDSFDVEELRIKKAFVDAGPTLKRWLPRAMGRATPLKKRTCHITITLSDEE